MRMSLKFYIESRLLIGSAPEENIENKEDKTRDEENFKEEKEEEDEEEDRRGRLMFFLFEIAKKRHFLLCGSVQ